MPDFGDDEYLHMVCVESGNVRENAITLAPGERAVLDGGTRQRSAGLRLPLIAFPASSGLKNQNPFSSISRSMSPLINRRRFLQDSAAAGIGFSPIVRSQTRQATVAPNSKLKVLSIGVVGTIGRQDRTQVAQHPAVEISGLCDVDSNALATAAKDHPDAFTCRDYREAFSKYGDKFDAVIVSTPDHSHAPIMLTALANRKHVYGQKPLVHQLEELAMMEKAIAARPDLVTQVGNQRMASAGRRAAVEILRRGLLGKAVEAHVWVNSPNERDYFNLDRKPRRADFAAVEPRLEPVARPLCGNSLSPGNRAGRLALVVGLRQQWHGRLGLPCAGCDHLRL